MKRAFVAVFAVAAISACHGRAPSGGGHQPLPPDDRDPSLPVPPPPPLVEEPQPPTAPINELPVWVAPATEKIQPLEAERDTKSASISAARNEFEAFQVVITGAATGVRAEATRLVGPEGFEIRDIRLYRAALIDIRELSALDGTLGPTPDALIPDQDEIVGERRNAFPFDVPAGESRAIWVDVFVPPSAPAGVYTGSVSVRFDGETAVVPVELTVWPFILPSTSSVKSAFGVSYNTLESGHQMTAVSELRARYGQLGLDHRISLSKHLDDRWGDLANFDQHYGPLMNGTAPTRLPGAQLTSVEYIGTLTDTADLGRWAAHFEARGWFDRLFQYTCDEPPYQGCDWLPHIQERSNAAKAANPNFRTLVTTSIQNATEHDGAQYLDLMVPNVNHMENTSGEYAGNQRPKYDAFLAGGPLKEVWMYQACDSHTCGGQDEQGTGWPSYMIDASAVRNRAMQWMLFKYDATGELYWDTTWAYVTKSDPWVSQWDFTGNGDGTLFYPGTPAKIGGATHIPVASIRLKMIREGMEDYEYLRLVAEHGDPAFAKSVANALFPTMRSTGSVSGNELMAARAALARRIIELTQ